MEARASLGSVVIGEAGEGSSWSGAKDAGAPGAAGLQPRLGGHSPGTWGVIDKADENTKHESPGIFHDPPEKVSFFSLSHTHRFISDPHSNPRKLRELKGLAQGDTVSPTQAQVSWFPGACAQNVVFWLAEVSG